MLKNPDITIRTANDVVEAIKSEMKDSTKKFEFCIVESFPDFEREVGRDELPINGTSQLHSMYITDETLYFSEHSCLDCTVNLLCETCEKIPQANIGDVVRGNSPESDEDSEVIDDDEDSLNAEDEDTEDEETEDETTYDDENECIGIGDIVWAKHGKVWSPARVVGSEAVPKDILREFGRSLQGKIIVKWWGEEMYAALLERQVEILARNKIDEFRATKSTLISKLYHQAVVEPQIENYMKIHLHEFI